MIRGSGIFSFRPGRTLGQQTPCGIQQKHELAGMSFRLEPCHALLVELFRGLAELGSERLVRGHGLISLT